MNELDQFVKHDMKIKYYLRYCDDFVILSNSQDELQEIIERIGEFLNNDLKLSLHPNKVSIRKLNQGIDFLGYVVLPHHTVLRTKTKKRMFKRVNKKNLSSYTGLLSHCDGYELKQKVIHKCQN
ncbi:MAG: RNA-directed DNA polymerase [Patescibacteria group bacterium]